MLSVVVISCVCEEFVAKPSMPLFLPGQISFDYCVVLRQNGKLTVLYVMDELLSLLVS
jgi:hypothetical protein